MTRLLFFIFFINRFQNPSPWCILTFQLLKMVNWHLKQSSFRRWAFKRTRMHFTIFNKIFLANDLSWPIQRKLLQLGYIMNLSQFPSQNIIVLLSVSKHLLYLINFRFFAQFSRQFELPFFHDKYESLLLPLLVGDLMPDKLGFLKLLQ